MFLYSCMENLFLTHPSRSGKQWNQHRLSGSKPVSESNGSRKYLYRKRTNENGEDRLEDDEYTGTEDP